MPRFRCVDLDRFYNSPAALHSRGSTPQWHRQIKECVQHMPRGRQTLWGIPFRLGPKDLRKKGLLLLGGNTSEMTIPLKGRATHLCILHFCNVPTDPEANTAGGELLGEYIVEYSDGTRHVQPIRRRFEIAPFTVGWGHLAFGAAPSKMPTTVPDDPTKFGWGIVQTGTRGSYAPFQAWIYALENPEPERSLTSLILRATGHEPVAILGITCHDGPGHPLRHVPRRLYRLLLPAAERTTGDQLKVSLDMGNVTRVFAVPHAIDESWLKSVQSGLGDPPEPRKPTREFLFEATGAEGGILTARSGSAKPHRFPLGEAFHQGEATSSDGKARVELVHHGSQWLHVTVIDESTGKPTPTRIHFCGRHGEYLPPYGHHAVVNDRWFEDYGGDLKLGDTSYAYVPGRFQIELPVGECYVEICKGFEYRPVRRSFNIEPGQRELELRIPRVGNWREKGWVTADTHVHFISPETAWLEGQAEGLNLINLLASQWGRLFTNVGDITGEASGCSRDDTIVWVGTENRNHLLGHISMLGTHGNPVFPMCTGGADEAYLGDPDVTLLTEWAQACRKRDGVVIRPHFPSPICEEPVYFMLEQLDGAELRAFPDPESGSLDVHCFKEWYRYLNCGCRVAAVGGTDKMSAGMPVGGVRTYARLGPNDEFTFENWGKAVRAGRTFTTSGPIIDLTVDGKAIGDEIRMPAEGGTVEVHAMAESIWPIHRLEVVFNGRVVAQCVGKRGVLRLGLRNRIAVKGSGWIAARCGSRLRVNHCWPIHLGAHTSPIYVTCGDSAVFSPVDATYMLTLIDGGLTYLSTLSVRYDEKRHREMKSIFERARAEIVRRKEEHPGPR